MLTSETLKVIKQRRSIRCYKKEQIKDEDKKTTWRQPSCRHVPKNYREISSANRRLFYMRRPGQNYLFV